MSGINKKLRACLLCSFVATPQVFSLLHSNDCQTTDCTPRPLAGVQERGMPKLRASSRGTSIPHLQPFACSPYLVTPQMKGSSERVMEVTTGQFDGTIALISPTKSWVAKWQRNDKHLPGVYAVRVSGTLPESTMYVSSTRPLTTLNLLNYGVKPSEDLEARGIKVHSREMNDD
ncbi:transcription elongation factor SPT4, partial [Phenoliferia sp. Uapishka_3]